MLKFIPAISLAAFAVVAGVLIGCNPQPSVPMPPPIKQYASTQTADIVAELKGQSFTRGELDRLLYETYGLRILFDLVELRLAENTLNVRGMTIAPDDFQNERQHILDGIRADETRPDVDPHETPVAKTARLQAYAADSENLFNQFLQQQHITKAEFDVKVIQTGAVLRKIVSALVVGKVPDATVHQAFEQLYGAKRKIADIQLLNMRDAAIAAKQLKTQPFAQVAQALSTDEKTRAMGGQWEQPFTTQSKWVDQAIIDQAFTLQKGQISDILNTADAKYHIIMVVDTIPPKLVKFDDVRDDVRKQIEDRLIVTGMKSLREELAQKAQAELVFNEPILKAQWDALVDEQTGKYKDRESARQALNAQAAKGTTQPTTAR